MAGESRWVALLLLPSLALLAAACGADGGERAAPGQEELGTALRSVTRSVPAGTSLVLTLDQTLPTAPIRTGDAFSATLAEPIRASDGTAADSVLIPQGATVHGRVTAVDAVGDDGGAAVIKLAFESVSFDDESHALRAALIDATFEPRGGADEPTDTTAAPAPAGGRILGPVLDTTRVSGPIAAAAGTAIALGAAGADVVLPAGSRIVIRLKQPITLRKLVS